MPDVFVSPDEQLRDMPPVLPEKEPVTEVQKSALPGHSHNVFSSFSLYPDDLDFETKEDNEKIILMLRHHPIVNVKWIAITIVLLFGPTLLNIFGIFGMLPLGYSLFITLAWYLLTFAYAFEGFLSWYFDVYFITTMRIVDINFLNLINKKVSDAEVTKIQDVSYTSGGFLGAIFNFGNVFIQTAADVQEFKFGNVSNPEKVAKILDDFMVKEK
ncbi:MAG: hypothetical protein ABSE04_01560 [Candidatus Microgenomates bacterium]|jgi:hypothetical protein